MASSESEPYTLSMKQEKIVDGKKPLDLGEIGDDMFNGSLGNRFDPNQETKTLYSKAKIYGEMSADPTISGGLQGYTNILSLVSWKTHQTSRDLEGISKEEYDESKAITQRDFIASCFADGASVESLVEEALTELEMGFQVVVPQFKVRAGENDNTYLNSKHDDGKIGWKSWKSIKPESIDRWIVPDGEGYEDLQGVRQYKKRGGYEDIPRNRMLLFRTTPKNSNIEGESILYGSVATWKRLQNTLGIEQVSLSRNLEGIPVLRIGSEYLDKDASDANKRVRDIMLRQVKTVKYNEQTALVLPSDVDENGNRKIDIELLTAGPNVRVDQCRTTASAQEQLIAESILANFMKLGSGGGSYAMSSSLQDMFVLAMKKYLDGIARVINEEAIPTLLKANGMDTKYAPYVDHEGLNTDSMGVFVDALVKSVQTGIVVPTKELQKEVLDRMKLPSAEADAEWDKVVELQEKLIQQEANQQAGTTDGTSNAGGTPSKPTSN